MKTVTEDIGPVPNYNPMMSYAVFPQKFESTMKKIAVMNEI